MTKTPLYLEGCWGEYYKVGDRVKIHLDDPELLSICEKCDYTKLIGPIILVGTYAGHTDAGNGRVKDAVEYDSPMKCPKCGLVQTHFLILCEKHSKFGVKAGAQETQDAPCLLTRVREILNV